MKLHFEISPEDVGRARKFFATQSGSEFVLLKRQRRNVEGHREPIDRSVGPLPCRRRYAPALSSAAMLCGAICTSTPSTEIACI